MKQLSLFLLFLVCMTLPPWGVHTAEAQTAPTFEQVFDGRSLPTFFADVDGDGKQEYVMENPHQWRSLSGQKVMPMPDDMYVSWFDWSMLQLNAEPWPAFARFQRNSYDSFGDEDRSRRCRRLAVIVPVLLHGAYDFIATLEFEGYAWIFVAFVAVLFLAANRMIKTLSRDDRFIDYNGYNDYNRYDGPEF